MQRQIMTLVSQKLNAYMKLKCVCADLIRVNAINSFFKQINNYDNNIRKHLIDFSTIF